MTISVKYPDGSIHEIDIPEELPPNRKGEISPDMREEESDLDVCYGRPLPKEKRTPEYREEIGKRYEKEYGKGE